MSTIQIITSPSGEQMVVLSKEEFDLMAANQFDEDAETLRIYRESMTAIERGEGAEDAVVRGWLTKALTASRGPQWVCDKCQSIHGHWAPVCANCGGFDTLSWRVPAEGEVAMPGSTEMLPLIVGQIEPPAEEDDGEDAEVIDVVEVRTAADDGEAATDKPTADDEDADGRAEVRA